MNGLARREDFLKKTRKTLGLLERSEKTARRRMALGIGLTIIDPIIATPVAIAGIARALGNSTNMASFRRRLLKNQKTAMLLAKEFRGTKHEAFFEEILTQIEKNKQREMMRKLAGLKGSRKIPLHVGLRRLFKR